MFAFFHETFDPASLVAAPSETELLAAQDIERSVITLKYTNDAKHVVTCTVAKIDYLESWNFPHPVNVQREAGFIAVKLLQGYEAGSPAFGRPPATSMSPRQTLRIDPMAGEFLRLMNEEAGPEKAQSAN